MFFSNVFYPKVVNDKIKGDWTPLMCSQPGHCFALGVTVFLKPFCQQFLCNDPCLREPVRALMDFAVDIPVGCCNVEQVVMCNDVFWHVGEF
jgi:hypothetical protein